MKILTWAVLLAAGLSMRVTWAVLRLAAICVETVGWVP